jgi:hypothetical protein
MEMKEGTQSTYDILYNQKPFSPCEGDNSPMINKSFAYPHRAETTMAARPASLNRDRSKEAAKFARNDKNSATQIADDHSQITSNYKSFKERISLKKTDRSSSKSGTRSRGMASK